MVGAVAILLCLLLSGGAVLLFQWYGEDNLQHRLQDEAEHFSQDISALLRDGGQLGALGLIGLARVDLKGLLNGPHPEPLPQLAVLMENLVHVYGGDAVYIVGRDGQLRDAWGPGAEDVARDLSFRPYIRRALAGQENAYAGISMLNSQRYWYFAAPVYEGTTKESAVPTRPGRRTDSDFCPPDGLSRCL